MNSRVVRNIHGNISAQLTIESAEPSTYHQRWLRERPDDYGADVRTLLEVGEMLLATHYCGESIRVAWRGGMEAVVDLPEWAEVLERNPRNRERFLQLDPREFMSGDR